MISKKIDPKTGKVLEIQEDGKTIWKAEDSIRRDKIGDKTAQKLRDAQNVKEIKEYLARVHDVDLGDSSA